MDFLSPACSDMAANEFQKMLALGSEGWLWDEVCHHGPVALLFFARLTATRRPAMFMAGICRCPRRSSRRCRQSQPGLSILSGEGPQDWLMQYYPGFRNRRQRHADLPVY